MFDDYYGLTGKPFQLTPDPAFYFHTASHRKALACLGYGLAQGEAVIFVSGESGTGKSMLVAHLMGLFDPQQMAVAQVDTGGLEEGDLINAAAQAFGLQAEGLDRAGTLASIEGFLHGEARAGRRCLLVADDSQKLSVDALEDLRVLSGFQFGSRSLLQTLLVGRSEFRATLHGDAALESMRQRVRAAHHLEPMTRAEIEPYIVRRLERVGWSGRPQFDQRVFAELHAASDGIPLRVNQIAGRLLLLGAVERRSRIDAVMLRIVLEEIAAERALALERPDSGSAGAAPEEGPASNLGERLSDRETIAAALADCETRIAELQRAVVERAGPPEGSGSLSVGVELEALTARLAGIEARIDEQDRALRRTLAMLIDWIDGATEPSRAA